MPTVSTTTSVATSLPGKLGTDLIAVDGLDRQSGRKEKGEEPASKYRTQPGYVEYAG